MSTTPTVCPTDSIVFESVTISRDAMPHHYIARAVILDLEPLAIVAALAATLDRIREQHPHAVMTGWAACCDGLRIYFYAWSLTTWTNGGRHGL
jgi:hypothetical protein